MTATNPTRRKRIRRPRGHVVSCSCDSCHEARVLMLAREARDILDTCADRLQADQMDVIAEAIWSVYGEQLRLFEATA